MKTHPVTTSPKRASVRSSAIRGLGLLALLAGGAVLFGFPLAEKREEARIRAALLALQEGLQKFHVREEIYPRTPMSGQELASFLAERGFLEKPVANPWTGEPYADSAEPDWLRYRTDQMAETYELVVTRRDSEEVRFRLDSTEHQSLE